MYLGLRVLVRHEGQVQEGNVERIYDEELDIRLLNGILVRRKYWEIRKCEIKDEE